ncbi:dihydropyrimidinase [Sporolactobacillus laevolacticus]|uniref:Phenylhydantoinase n=1 Tax=Sporolactobacillus laevolacticus DSM 442 TaxID=1395513 RepID=V6IX56_9BACL|nr:dihydropyrimidinase [Sporolactobacillus laevolacticus]EST11191.1 phenylhydantoinase [Sporolactobacillus laevolacticus DSM 442]
MKGLIKNGTIVTSERVVQGDLYMSEGIIQMIGNCEGLVTDEVIDASGLYILPGGVDVHTHLNLHQGNYVATDDFYTGTVAAACGGTTCIVDHMEFGPAGCSLKNRVDVYHGYAYGKAVIDYSFHGVIQHVDEAILDEMASIIENEGITSFKIYLTYDYKLDDEAALRVMKRLGDLGAVTAIHCENDGILSFFKKHYLEHNQKSPIFHALSRPEEAEAEAVGRMITLSEIAGDAPIYIVHVSTAKAAKIIAEAKQKKRNVHGETCPQYLFLDQECYREPDNGGLKYIMSPPLRRKSNQNLLWNYISEGTLDVIGTDHCPFNFHGDKQAGRDDFSKCPNGAPGIETRIPLLFSEGVMKKRISLQDFVKIISTNPAKLMGLYPKKGDITVGADADLVMIDPKKKVTLRSDFLHEHVDYTCYEGFELQGYPVMTLSRGEVICKDGAFIGHEGRGQFLKRKKVNDGVRIWN